MLSPTPKWSTTNSSRGLGSGQRLDKLIAITLICVLLISWSNFLGEGPHLPTWGRKVNAIANETLGFEKIYVIALPGRGDRTKPLRDAAKATNLSLTFLEAVRDADIEGRPDAWVDEHHTTGELGCLISHVRTWNKIIANRVSTALILESDADWDMRIKDIMPSLAQGIKTLVDWPFGRPHHTQDPGVAPYGDTWDIIWIGHCGSNHDGNFRIYSWNDTTVPPEDREYWFDTGLSPEQHTPGTRSVYQFGRTTCSSGYAISLQGAAKLVEYFKSSDENLDLKLSSACTRETDMTCLGVWPQIVTAVNTKSNIDHDGDGVGRPEDSEELHIEAGPALQFSARVNAKGVIESGYGRDEWIPEWNTSWAMKNGKWSLVKMNRTMDGGDELQPEKGKEELKETDVSDGGEIGSYEAYAGTTNAASRGERQEDGRRWKVKRA